MRRLILPAGLLFVLAGAVAPAAQDSGIKRTLLQRFGVNEKMEAVMVMAEIPKGVSAGRHTHHGVETSFVQEGEIEVRIETKVRRNTGSC